MATKKTWVLTRKTLKAKPTEDAKERSLHLADKLIETDLKPKHVKRPPKNNKFNYIVDIYTKWFGNSLYFCAKYSTPDGANSFESKNLRTIVALHIEIYHTKKRENLRKYYRRVNDSLCSH